jgi:hypothetical protein
MPAWAVILGSGGVAGILVGLIAPVINHKLQQRRERERESREARATWVARQREVCTGLLEAVVDFRRMLHTFRTLHDDLESRLAAKEMLELPRQQMQPMHETVRRVRSELDLEPNAQLQGALERWGDAGTAYQQALARPMSSRWHLFRFYFGKTPPGEINRLADNYDAQIRELQDAVREHMASLEAPAKAVPARRLPGLPRWPRWPRLRRS